VPSTCPEVEVAPKEMSRDIPITQDKGMA